LEFKKEVTWETMTRKHNFYVENEIYEKIYKEIINIYTKKVKQYLKKANAKKQEVNIFRCLSTDTTFISNKYCVGLPRNKFYKSKKGIKVSAIVDLRGVGISLMITEGNLNDCKIGYEHFKQFIDERGDNKLTENELKYFLADSGYDTKEFRDIVEKEGYKVIIRPNNRNTKNKKKLRKLTPEEEEIYKKRYGVEHSFSWLKANPKLNFVVEKSLKSFAGLVYLHYSVHAVNTLFKLNLL
jgi:transposase